MTVQYDGSRYSGWQRQGNTDNTIQYKLEKTISEMLGETIEVAGSGRTDAGVHALGQVANFKTEQRLVLEDFYQTINEMLPGDIAVTSVGVASPRFHARLSAKEKTYRYSIRNDVAPDVFGRRYQYQIKEPLDLGAMKAAAQLFIGTYDFKGFSTGHTKKSTIRAIKTVDIKVDGSLIEIYFTGNGFLYNMVRIMTGTLLEVGLGQRSPESILRVFETKDRKDAGFTAPPQGLCLMEVMY